MKEEEDEERETSSGAETDESSSKIVSRTARVRQVKMLQVPTSRDHRVLKRSRRRRRRQHSIRRIPQRLAVRVRVQKQWSGRKKFLW